MEANAVSDLLFTKYGKKWHFITPDYAFGHTLQKAAAADLKKLGGTMTGNELTPLGTTDFSAYLIKARAANPDVLLVLPQGSDMVNCLKQIAQFGIEQADPCRRHAAGARIARGDAARGAHRHLDVRMVLEAAGRAGRREVRRRHPQDERRQGADGASLVRLHLGAHARAVANQEKTLDARKLAEALGDFELPDDVKLQPNKCYYRKGDHQLMTSAFVGEALTKAAGDPEDLFRSISVVAGDKTSPPESDTGCKIAWPA